MASLLKLPPELLQLITNCLRFGRLYPPSVRCETYEWIGTARVLRQTCKVLRDYIDGVIFGKVEVQSLCEWNTSRLNALVQSPWLSQAVHVYHLAPTLRPNVPDRTLLDDYFFEDSYDPDSQFKYPDHKELQQFSKKHSRNKDGLKLCNEQWLIIWSQSNHKSWRRMSSLYKSVTKRSHSSLSPIFHESIYMTAPEMFSNLTSLIVAIPSYSDSYNLIPRVGEQMAIGLGQLLARKQLSISELQIEINPQHVALIMKGAAPSSIATDSVEGTVTSLHSFTVESVETLHLLMYDRSQHKLRTIPCPRRRARVWQGLDAQDGIGKLLATFPNLKLLNMRFNSRKGASWSASNEWLVLDKLNAPMLPKLEVVQLIKMIMYPSELVKLTVQFVEKDHSIQDYSCRCRSLKTVDLFLIRRPTELSTKAMIQHKDESVLDDSSEYLHATTWADVYYAWSRRLIAIMESASPSSEPVWRKSIFDNDMYLDIRQSKLEITRQTAQDTKAFDDWHEFQYIRWPRYKGTPGLS